MNTALCAILTLQLASAGEPPAHVQAYLKRCEAAKQQALDDLRQTINALEVQGNASPERKAQVDAARARLARLESQPAPMASLPLPPREGDIGVFEGANADLRPGRQVDVIEIVDDDEAVVRAWYLSGEPGPNGSQPSPVFVDLWMRGVSTAGMTAMSRAELPQVFQAIGVRGLSTDCGTRNLLVIEPIDIPGSSESRTATGAIELPPRLARWLGPQKWERDVDGPSVSLGKPEEFDGRHIFAPAVALEDGKFSLWYCGSIGAQGQRVFRLGLAQGTDGKHFEKVASNPVFEFGDGKHSILTPTLLRNGDGTLLREDGKLRMWFAAAWFAGGKGLHQIHESSSVDGVKWTEPSPAEITNAYAPTVIKDGDKYRIWYTDVSKRPWRIRHATSADGRSWDVTPDPVLELGQFWESEILVYPHVLKIDEAYLMWYGSYTAARRQTTAVGFAVSDDGIHWHRHPQNPVFNPDPAREWEANYVGNTAIMRLPDGSFRMWYASRKKPPFVNLYFAINTARWAGPRQESANK